jgi:large subunit ribosomal protein L6
MSKIGRKPIDIRDTQVTVSGQEIQYKGKHGAGVYVLPNGFTATLEGKKLIVKPQGESARKVNVVWGMLRALLANKIEGAQTLFEQKLQINGLGFKAALSGKKLVFSLGFSHKIEYDLPSNITVEIDKTGQLLTLKSSDKELLGAVCDRIRSFRPPEPYKGTGIKLETETIIRKAGKAKAA